MVSSFFSLCAHVCICIHAHACLPMLSCPCSLTCTSPCAPACCKEWPFPLSLPLSSCSIHIPMPIQRHFHCFPFMAGCLLPPHLAPHHLASCTLSLNMAQVLCPALPGLMSLLDNVIGELRMVLVLVSHSPVCPTSFPFLSSLSLSFHYILLPFVPPSPSMLLFALTLYNTEPDNSCDTNPDVHKDPFFAAIQNPVSAPSAISPLHLPACLPACPPACLPVLTCLHLPWYTSRVHRYLRDNP